MIGVSETEKLDPRVKASILNLYTIQSIEQIIKGLINYDLDFFVNKYKQELDEQKNNSHRIIRKIDEGILAIMKKQNRVEGSSTELFITILENEFFSVNEKYEELFHEKYINNLEYYFNSRKVYGLNFFDGEISVVADEIYLELSKKFKNPNENEFKNKLITSYIKIEDNYFYFKKSDSGLKVYEKIGIQKRTTTGGVKSVFVCYYFDLKNNYFEISYNDSAIKDLSKDINRKNILLDIEQNNENSGEEISKLHLLSIKFGSETATLRTLKTRMKKLSRKKINISSLNSGISSEYNSRKIDKDFKIPVHLKQFYESPYEGVMYLYFKENRERIVSKYLDDDNTRKLETIKSNSKRELEGNYSEEVEKSIKFLNYLIVFSKLKNLRMEGKNVEDHIYAFTVRDHEVTKTSTKNSQRMPVYNTDFYWHLQEVADSIKQLSELGLFKTVIDQNDKLVSQEMKIAYLNDHLHFVYYQKSKNNNSEDAIKISGARRLVHESIKSEFRKIISKEI